MFPPVSVLNKEEITFEMIITAFRDCAKAGEVVTLGQLVSWMKGFTLTRDQKIDICGIARIGRTKQIADRFLERATQYAIIERYYNTSIDKS